MARAVVSLDDRRLDLLVLHGGIEPALHQNGIARGIGSEPVEARLAVEIALGRIDLAGELVVEEAAAVVEPRRVRALGVGDALGQVGPVRGLHHVQDRILAPVLRQAVDDVRAVGRGVPPVERQMAGGARERGGIDEHAPHAALLDEQPEVVGARRPLLDEQPPAGALYTARERDIARELLDVREQRFPARYRVEHRARVRVLSLEIGQPLRVLVGLHPAVRITQRLAEIAVGHDRDARHRRRRDGGDGRGAGGGRRRGGRAAASEPCGDRRTGGARDQLTTTEGGHGIGLADSRLVQCAGAGRGAGSASQ